MCMKYVNESINLKQRKKQLLVELSAESWHCQFKGCLVDFSWCKEGDLVPLHE